MSIMSKYQELKDRIVFTLLALIVYRFGTNIPVPGVDPVVLADITKKNLSGMFGMLDMFSGGAFSNFSIFTLSLIPYISASIVIQLLSVSIPYLEHLRKEGGEFGRKKLNKYTKILTIILAGSQGYGMSVWIFNHDHGSAIYLDNLFFLISVPSLIAGTLFLVWLGGQITSRGIGNGISLIIFSGIVSNLPQAFLNTFELGRSGTISITTFVGILIVIVVILFAVVLVERAQRKILIQYPKNYMAMQRNLPQNSSQYIPFKINNAGVMPPIFAQCIVTTPMTIAHMMGSNYDGWFGSILSFMERGGGIKMTVLAFLITFFAFFYISIQFNPMETAENLRKNGGVVPGIRPGIQTGEFFESVLNKLTVLGSIYLVILCLLPEFLMGKFMIPFYFGGTSILIVVGVTIDVATKIKSYVMSEQYSGLMKRVNKSGNLKRRK